MTIKFGMSLTEFAEKISGVKLAPYHEMLIHMFESLPSGAKLRLVERRNPRGMQCIAVSGDDVLGWNGQEWVKITERAQPTQITGKRPTCIIIDDMGDCNGEAD